jgi:hypothetical protein
MVLVDISIRRIGRNITELTREVIVNSNQPMRM